MEGNPEKIQNVRTAVGRNKKEQREGRGTVRVIRQWAVQFGTSAIEATAAESPPIRGRRSQINHGLAPVVQQVMGHHRKHAHAIASPWGISPRCPSNPITGNLQRRSIGRYRHHSIRRVRPDHPQPTQPAIVGTHLSTALCCAGRLDARRRKL